MNKRSIITSWNKFDFPLQFVVVWDRLIRRLSFVLSTLHFKCLLRFYGAKYGRNIRSDGMVIIRCARKGRISIGDNAIINSCVSSNLVGRTNPAIFECYKEGSISIGSNSGLSFPVISSRSGIFIGDNVKIGGNVRIFDHDFHSIDPAIRRTAEDCEHASTRPVHIGDDVFIGTNALILKGVTIGARSIVGAGAVVSRSIPENEIWAGNPARKVRDLIEKRTV